MVLRSEKIRLSFQKKKIRYLQIISHYVKSFDGSVNKLPIIFLLFPPFYYTACSCSSILLFFGFSKFQNINEKWVSTVWYEFTILCQFYSCPKTLLPIFSKSGSTTNSLLSFNPNIKLYVLKTISTDFQWKGGILQISSVT